MKTSIDTQKEGEKDRERERGVTGYWMILTYYYLLLTYLRSSQCQWLIEILRISKFVNRALKSKERFGRGEFIIEKHQCK